MYFTDRAYLYQFIAVLSGTLSVVSIGIHSGWTSPYLPKMMIENSTEIYVTNDEGSWIAVTHLLGGCIGALLILPMCDRFGRKFSILFWAPIMASTFLILAFGKTVALIYAARFVAGCAQGSIYSALPMYIAEISDPKVRGSLSVLSFILLRVGILFIYVIGPYTTIYVSSLICVTIPIVHFIIFAFMPESPYYFLMKQMNEEAERSLKWLRGSNDVRKELNELDTAVRRQEGDKSTKMIDLFSIACNRRAVLIYVIMTVANNFSGKEPYQYYAIMIFSNTDSSLSGNISAIIYCFIDIVTIFSSLLLVDKINRRSLIVFSMIGCVVFLALEGLYFYFLKYNESYVGGLGWWPIVGLIGYNIAFNMGLSLAPLLLLGELFPTNIKTAASCFGELFWLLTAVGASKIFQATADGIGMFMPFWTFSACCLVLFPLVMKYLPETRGKTLEEIQLGLINNKKI